ncbi:hypothetical protein RSOLAG22IIIB_13481 [Rhizoctonia solani]|uniref:Protein kinase domain-containing protein n=1 Tax=Rhizoctonia solani TaxID=456999 RepID=A0A0K6FN01_9AGAM|nr:hypothetical protein RSOLAG22IIIB_13481 [Rhizoctonia solani]
MTLQNQIPVLSNGVPRILLSVETTTTLAYPFGTEGRTRWTAPELVEPGAQNTMASDVYALGMTILETLTRCPPYFELLEHEEDEPDDILEIISLGDFPQRPIDILPETEAGEVIWDILCECWCEEPTERPTAANVGHIMYMARPTPDGPVLSPPGTSNGEYMPMEGLE